MVIDRIRPSIGTAVALGLKKGKLPYPPRTAYLMIGQQCLNNCVFCTQAREAAGMNGRLSRVTWPSFAAGDVLQALGRTREQGFKRICLQCLNDPEMLSDLPGLVGELREASNLPISVSAPPASYAYLRRLKAAGAERIGVAIDAASEDTFYKIKGEGAGNRYSWSMIWNSLEEALSVFGPGKVSTHLIVGLGESDRDIIDTMIRCTDSGILLSLFAYTPMEGTVIIGPPPPIERYRALQVARELITSFDEVDMGIFQFDENGKLTGFPELIDEVRDWESVFRTRGCPNCDRPYYNESPRGPFYNYPRALSRKEVQRELKEALTYAGGRKASEDHQT